MSNSAPTDASRDHFLGGRLAIDQPVKGYRAGSDPLFMAAAIPLHGAADVPGRVLDLGCGVGTAGLCLLTRLSHIHVTGLDVQADLLDMAAGNAQRNGLGDRFVPVLGCASGAHALAPYHAFDHVMTNPPWYEPGSVRPPPSHSKSIGHMEGDLTLAAWLAQAVRFLRPKGGLTVMHRGDRLGDILAALAGLKVGAVRVFPLWPRQGQAAGRVIVQARKDSKAPFSLLPGLVLHHDDGSYTDQAQAVLRDGAPLICG